MTAGGYDTNGAWVEALTLHHSLTAPREARRFVRRLAEKVPELDDLELLLSELVTNAVIHAGGDVQVTISIDTHRVHVEVGDTNRTPPALRTPDGTGGRGLRLVDAVATRWGIIFDHSGKSVWFEVDAAYRGQWGQSEDGEVVAQLRA